MEKMEYNRFAWCNGGAGEMIGTHCSLATWQETCELLFDCPVRQLLGDNRELFMRVGEAEPYPFGAASQEADSLFSRILDILKSPNRDWWILFRRFPVRLIYGTAHAEYWPGDEMAWRCNPEQNMRFIVFFVSLANEMPKRVVLPPTWPIHALFLESCIRINVGPVEFVRIY
jgi:hypothetical protein